MSQSLPFLPYTIKTVRLLVSERISEAPTDRPEIAAELIARLFEDSGEDECVESFWLLAVDGRHNPIGFKRLAVGTRNQTPVDVGAVFRSALALGAAGIIIAHNHPSGTLHPRSVLLRVVSVSIGGGTYTRPGDPDEFTFPRWFSPSDPQSRALGELE